MSEPKDPSQPALPDGAPRRVEAPISESPDLRGANHAGAERHVMPGQGEDLVQLHSASQVASSPVAGDRGGSRASGRPADRGLAPEALGEPVRARGVERTEAGRGSLARRVARVAMLGLSFLVVGGAVWAVLNILRQPLEPAGEADPSALSARLAAVELQVRERGSGSADPKAVEELGQRVQQVERGLGRLDGVEQRLGRVEGLEQRLAKIESAPQGANPADPANGAAIASLQKGVGELQARIERSEAAAREAQARADGANRTADTARDSAAAGIADTLRGEMGALQQRLAALEQSSGAVRDELARIRPFTDATRLMQRAFAASALRQAVDRGEPYTAELAAVRTLGGDGANHPALDVFAQTGVPQPAALTRELMALLPRMRAAAAEAPREDGVVERLQANASRLVRLRQNEEPAAGQDARAALSRVELFAGREDLGGAMTELLKLPDAARAPGADWLRRAQAREGVIAAARQIAADTLGQMAQPAR